MKILIALLLAFSCLALIADMDVVTVKGKGAGINETAALKDAYRDAVETAVGLYVDAEQMVKNDEVVEDQILTQSNAYIESYDVLKKSVANGVCTIKILAKVKTKPLTKKLSTTMKTQTVEVGSGLRNLYAKEVSKKKSGEDGAALLKNVLAKLDPIKQLIDVELTDVEPVVLNKNDDKANDLKLAYLFKSTISEERYFNEFMPPLRDVLAQIAVSKPTKTSLSVSERELYCQNGRRPLRLSDVKYEDTGYHDACKCVARVSSAELGDMRGGGSTIPHPVVVTLVVKVNKLHTLYTCELFELDKHAEDVFSSWIRTRINEPYGNDPCVRVSFADEGDDELAQASVVVGTRRSFSSCAFRDFGRGGGKNYLVLAPWFVDYACFERYAWRKISLPKEALPLVKKIKVDLVK